MGVLRIVVRVALQLVLAIVTLLIMQSAALAQNISLDHPVKCGKLQCFPSADVENEFYYLPSNPHVALTDEGTPEFSFTRYVKSSADSTAGEGGGIKEADGGGIVHFLIDYTVSDKQLQKARAALQEINQDAVLRGPIIFTEGNFALVSSFAPDDDKPSDLTKHVVGVGRAPLIEGLKAAVSIHLTKLGAQILWRSFQMQTPDVSLVFEMTFSGLNDPADAVITADWTKLQNQADVNIGGKVAYLGIGAEFNYGNFWEKAEQSGAITIEYKGDPDKLQAIVDRAYARLHDMMFEPIAVNESQASDDDPLSTMSTVLNQARNASGSNYSAPWEVKISGGYKRRKITRSGHYKFNFRQRSSSSLTTAMAGNIGSLYKTWGDDPTIFRTVNLTDEEFRIREVSVSLDARDEKEFKKYINHVTFSLRKKHGSGNTSTGELTIKRNNFEAGRPLKVSYNWDNEASADEWMRFEYKADWSFVGGAQYSSGWVESDRAAISLTPPYQYREIEFVSSPDILQEGNVRLVSVRVKHDFFGREVKETINLIPSRDLFNVSKVFAVPPGKDSIEYTITWSLNDRKKITSGALTTDETIIFCDELPPAS